MPPEKHTTTCESCGKTFKLTGIGPHCKSCIRQARKTNEDRTHFDLLLAEPEVDINIVDDIRVEYHPNAGKPTVKVPFAEFTRGHAPKTYKPDPCTAPWYPFRTCLDFDLSEFIHDAALNKEQVNCILKLLKCSRTEDWTLNNYNDLESTQQAASHRMTAFQTTIISAPFGGETMEFKMYYCSLWDWACDLLKDSGVGPYFVFDAQHLSKFDGASFVRFIDEPWMANEFWDVQSDLPSDGKVLAFVLYADKAKLSSFGRQKGYPVVAWIANLPTWICNGEGLGGGRVVGWLLIVKEDKKYSGKKLFANFKNRIWHELFKKILDTISEYSKTGYWVRCWDGVACRLFPTILILSADYEEQAVMALICGVMSNHPCPVCLIHRNEISKFPKDCECCTSENIFKTLQEACSQTQADGKEQILVKQGLCDVDSAFWEVGNMDVYRALCWDRLHANCVGKFGNHLWGELLRILETMGKVEQNLNVMPRWRSLNHFEEALSVSYTDGQKFEDLSKIIVFACHDIFPHEMEKDGYLLLRCLRAYIEFDMYTTLKLHMTHTLAAGREALATFNSLIQKYAGKTQHTGKNWNFPKNHTCMHMFDDIEAKGVTHNFNTKPNEKMHGPLKEAYQKQTNFKDVAQQILNVDHLGLVLEHIRCRITEYDAYRLTGKPTNLDNLEAITDEPEEEFFHVKFGSEVKELLTFEDIKKKSVTDNAFNRFHGKLSEFLNKHFNIIGKPLPGRKPIQFQRNDKIVEYRFIKVNFESTIDWCQYTDYLCCHPNFHGRPRYDCVLVKTQEKDIFGRLVLLFNCVVGEETFPLALLQPYDTQLIGQRLWKDNHLNFWRVGAQPRRSSEIISVHSIIHGALLYPDHTRPGEYLIVDTIDTDMFLRVQMMHKAAGHL
ncbi:hypothetical protein M404DRAFT_966485 [Pisolithus tinctorius Marx 270]|uniref:Uncharacterized protein n=1 Tax=Pisolithus tinctorius Marx 270 TaxID=870435 RepID=A0A0C3JMU0_PISTI|nr:hypothetical protein M404DRAFT_966485 [Pisolithus tinctorius Marx 270]